MAVVKPKRLVGLTAAWAVLHALTIASALGGPCLDVALVTEGATRDELAEWMDDALATGLFGSVVTERPLRLTADDYDAAFLFYDGQIAPPNGQTSFEASVAAGNAVGAFIDAGGV